MKLNSGCGLDYLDGYVNIDIDRKSKADKIMPAFDLDFENGIFEEILARQVIEHLGFFKTRYFMSEAYRTLSPGGVLKIETPNIEKSFENFLKAGNSGERELVLGWIYGGESEHMTHVYCFPVELMKRLAKESGFNVEKTEFYDYEYLRPAVRYLMIKEPSAEKFRKALLRRELLNLHFPKWGDESAMAEQEQLIERLEFSCLEEKDVKKIYGFNPAFSKAVAAVFEETSH
ncbi:MAG: hypothetical protein COT17_03675 [Elusimicrobia bacterium CG08_land_8_20_14_0_20_51_18]|nr:MAG: hypothetical protein COT17_03675 [Elusimicrobia bacterium CG08_land_8_20_14_0_20_51_18]